MVNINQLMDEIMEDDKAKRWLKISQKKATELHNSCEHFIDCYIRDALSRNIHCHSTDSFGFILWNTNEEKLAMIENLSIFEDVISNIIDIYKKNRISLEPFKGENDNFVSGSNTLHYISNGFEVNFHVTW